MNAIKIISVLAAIIIIAAIIMNYSGYNTLDAGRTAAVAPPEFWVKVGFSALFSIAALYIIIFKPDADEQTRTWAFGALSLVAGVWIGTATTNPGAGFSF